MKKKNRKIKALRIWIAVLTFILITTVGIGAYLYFFYDASLAKGSWTRKVDMTNEVVTSINKYLSEAAFGDELDAADYIDNISLQITLELGPKQDYAESVSHEDYEEAVSVANDALKVALKELILKRMSIAEVQTDKDVDTLVKEAIGMSLEEYIANYGPQLLPEYEELEQKYASNGTYTVDRDKIYMDADHDNIPDDGGYNQLISEDSLLIIKGDHEYVYTREGR